MYQLCGSALSASRSRSCRQNTLQERPTSSCSRKRRLLSPSNSLPTTSVSVAPDLSFIENVRHRVIAPTGVTSLGSYPDASMKQSDRSHNARATLFHSSDSFPIIWPSRIVVPRVLSRNRAPSSRRHGHPAQQIYSSYRRMPKGAQSNCSEFRARAVR